MRFTHRSAVASLSATKKPDCAVCLYRGRKYRQYSPKDPTSPTRCPKRPTDPSRAKTNRNPQPREMGKQRCRRRTHCKHDELIGAFPLDTRHHPANLIALRAFLAARRARRQLTLKFPKHQLGLDANTTPVLERLERHEPMTRKCELAHFRFALRHRKRQQ